MGEGRLFDDELLLTRDTGLLHEYLSCIGDLLRLGDLHLELAMSGRCWRSSNPPAACTVWYSLRGPLSCIYLHFSHLETSSIENG